MAVHRVSCRTGRPWEFYGFGQTDAIADFNQNDPNL